MNTTTPLPPGQYQADEFPRFGLARFANRFPKHVDRIELQIEGDVEERATVLREFDALRRVEQVSDFHCVTTWSYRSLRWSGFRFSDFFEQIIQRLSRPHPDARFVVLRCQDGYRASLPLDDLLRDDVLLADTLGGAPLTIEHGAPIRLIAPRHYGYKNAKHLSRIDFRKDDQTYRPAAYRFMEHPRARVALEERGRGIPGPILRYLYRPLVGPAIWRFRRAMKDYVGARSRPGV
jgi:DMSO/TMAO reductase YedYZ molybdopterin-dependent catalytic subunit